MDNTRYIDVDEIESTTAQLEQIEALVLLIHHLAEPLSMQESVWQADFKAVSLNLLTVHDMCLAVRQRIHSAVCKAYHKAEG